MNLNLFFDENEKPLENWTETGGYCSIFRTIACIGDSLASGEFESLTEDNQKGYHDMFEYSWGQFMARNMGSKVYNFSRGGMTAQWYLDSFANEKDFFNPEFAAQAYIVALGCNDIFGKKQEIGSIDDVKDDPKDNAATFAGYYGTILQRYREIQPDAKFFLMTFPAESENDERRALKEKHRDLLYDFAKKFDNTYVLDILTYGPLYDAEFKKRFFMGGHMNPMGYAFTALMTQSYIDYIIRHNMEDFKKIGFIGTPWDNSSVGKPLHKKEQ